MTLRLVPLCCLAAASLANASSLKESYEKDFAIGVAVSPDDVADPARQELIKKNFNSLSFENVLKWDFVEPKEGEFHYELADKIVDFARANGMKLVGHTFVWHSQTPDWVFVGPDGNPASRELLLERLKKHIQTVMTRYKGVISTWDVANEIASDEDGKSPYRQSRWFEILGPEVVVKAFEFAREADPFATLLYNDYGIEAGPKHDRAVQILKDLRKAKAPISGIGLQSHISIVYPPVSEIETSIRNFARLGLQVHITELDMSVYSGFDEEKRNLYPDACPPDLLKQQADRYGELFRMFRRNKSHIARVTFWNVHDGVSWLNQFPVPNRRNHPLLWDSDLKPKPAYDAVISAGAPKSRLPKPTQ